MTSEEENQAKLLWYLGAQYPSYSHIEVSNVARVTSGWETEVYAFRLEYEEDNALRSRDLILRMYPGEGAKQKATREFRAMSKLHDIGFPVPKVCCLETETRVFDRPFVVMESCGAGD